VDEVVDEIFIGGRTFGWRWGLLATPFPNMLPLDEPTAKAMIRDDESPPLATARNK
jgi:hypothetical protein